MGNSTRKYSKEEAPPKANMFLAFKNLMKVSKDVRDDAWSIANMYGRANPDIQPAPEFSYSQPAQALRIIDRENNIMITCKYNEWDEKEQDILDHVYIRPLETTKKFGETKGNGWLYATAWADGGEIESVNRNDKNTPADLRDYLEGLGMQKRTYLSKYMDYLLDQHDESYNVIPCIHKEDYLYLNAAAMERLRRGEDVFK